MAELSGDAVHDLLLGGKIAEYARGGVLRADLAAGDRHPQLRLAHPVQPLQADVDAVPGAPYAAPSTRVGADITGALKDSSEEITVAVCRSRG